MADEIDNAQMTSDFMTGVAIANAKRLEKKIIHTGFCANCRDAVSKEQLFCDQECAEDFEKRRRMSM